MPELPEVETVKENIKKVALGSTITNVDILYPRIIKTTLNTFVPSIIGSKIIDLSRFGKTIVFSLDNEKTLVSHLRMEGKFYFLSLEDELPKHSCVVFELNHSSRMVFVDTRKFGAIYLLSSLTAFSEPPLNNIGPDPFMVTDLPALHSTLKKTTKSIKEAILSQPIISGIGNIYADEILFACQISPFMPAKELTLLQTQDIVSNSKKILLASIELKGSTVKSYHPGLGQSGGFQEFIKVYDKGGLPCPTCHSKIEKRFLGGRGTSYCHRCQRVGVSVAITGPISSGKSTVVRLFEEKGFVSLSADRIVKEYYTNLDFNAKVASISKVDLIDGFVDKSQVSAQMNDKLIKRKIEAYIHPLVKEDILNFLNHNYDKKIVVEVPLLFEAKMQMYFSYVIGVVTSSKRQVDFLIKRGEDPESRLALNKSLSFNKHIRDLDFIIDNDGTEENLKIKIDEIINQIK